MRAILDYVLPIDFHDSGLFDLFGRDDAGFAEMRLLPMAARRAG